MKKIIIIALCFLAIIKANAQSTSGTFGAAVQKNYIANIAGTGYAIGEHLIQSLSLFNGKVIEQWINTDTKLQLTTIPTQAQMLANLGFDNTLVNPQWKPRKKWIAGVIGNANPGTPYNWVVIRNTNTFPVRVISLDLNLISTSVPAASSSSWNCNTLISMYTGATTITGGTAGGTVNVPSYTNDGTIVANSGATALGGTEVIIGSYVQPIVSYSEGGAAGFTAKTGVSYAHKWAEGLIIPAGNMLVIRNNNAFSAPVASTFSTWTAILTDEL